MSIQIIKYKDKKIDSINEPDIKAQVITYEIEKEDLISLSQNRNQEDKSTGFCLYKTWGDFELLYEDIEFGRLIQGGMINNICYLKYYIVTEGLEQLILLLSFNKI